MKIRCFSFSCSIVLIALCSCESKKSINDVDFQEYVGGSIACFISDVREPYHDLAFIEEPTANLSGCWLAYPEDSIDVYLYVDTFRFVKTQFDTARAWKHETLQKERISRIAVYYMKGRLSKKVYGSDE